MFRHTKTLVSCLLLATLAACTTTLSMEEDIGQYRAEIQRLQEQIRANPDDTRALRDLGVIYLRTSQFDQARSYLSRAYTPNPDDPETGFYYGLALEATGNKQEALDIYSRYEEMPRSTFRKKLAGRYTILIREVVRDEIRANLAREADFQNTEPNTIAVFPLTYQGGGERYEALGRGLSEMVAIDLSLVPTLNVVERVRLQALFDELSLGQTAAVDPGTAPRVGRILAAGRLIGGSYNVSDEVLRVDAATVEIAAATPDQEITTRSDNLNRLFDLEKDLVFSLLTQLGIEISPVLREQIEQVPTRNLQAFLAYSRGLREEDAGRFTQAKQFFELAALTDPNFQEAAEKAETMAGAEEVTGEPLAVVLITSPPSPVQAPIESLVQQRHQHLGASTGSGYKPDDESRNTPTGGAPSTELPRPRRPPDN